jgi:glycosyltransferase involved in cell wall biosynthesis
MSVPAVTIGIPFWNEEPFLAEAVRSILAQTWTDFELLLVDDGSSDGSLAIARSFDDPRVHVVSDGARRYLPSRLNEIVRRARGELVARMDGDDLSHPDRLRREIEALRESGPGCVGVGTWAGLVDARGEPFAVVEASAESSPAAALERGGLAHATLVARRSWLADNPYDEGLTRAEDRDLFCRTAGKSRFTVVPEPLYAVRVLPGRSTFLADYLAAQRQNREIMLRYGPRLLGWPGTARAWALSQAKGVAMRGAMALGGGERLVRRRGRAPTEAERRLIEAALAAGRQRP